MTNGGRFLSTLILFSLTSLGNDLGFRYRDGKCVDAAGIEGNNPAWIGECGDFSGKKLLGVDFSGKKLRGALFDRSDLEGGNFADSDLTGAKLRKSNLFASDFSRATLEMTDFSGATLSDSTLARVSAKGARFIETTLDSLKGELANLSGADLRNAHGERISFQDSDLSGANLRGAIFRKANLLRARLIDSNLTFARLDESDLRAANLSKANLRRSSLNGAAIEGTIWSASHFDKRTLLPFSEKQARMLGMKTHGWLKDGREIGVYLSYMFYAVRAKDKMMDANVYSACAENELSVPCNNSYYRDEKCTVVGARSEEELFRIPDIMDRLGLVYCPKKYHSIDCEALDRVFVYMGGKYSYGAHGGTFDTGAPRLVIREGINFSNEYALCFESID